MMKEFVLLLICHVLAFTSAQITVTPAAEAIVCKGETTTLRCKVTFRSLVIPGARWSRNGTEISTNVTVNNHYVAVNVTGDGQTDLIITDVALADSNITYSCSITGNDPPPTSVTLYVTDIPAVNNLMATDNCDSVSTSWDAITGVCNNSVQYNVTLTSSGDTIRSEMTDEISHTFDEDNENEYDIALTNLSSNITVSVVAVNGNFNGSSSPPITANLSRSNVPNIDITVVESCVSSLNVSWTDTTQCVPMSYTVMLTNTSSGELQNFIVNDTSYMMVFPGLSSNTSYNITVSGTNRFGQNSTMIFNSTLRSNVPEHVLDLTRKFINEEQPGDINITWTAPVNVDACTTSDVIGYKVVIDYTIDATIDTDSNNTTMTSILLSDFNGHPMANATYHYATVFARNERGLSGDVSIPLSRGGGGGGDGCFDKTWCIIVVVLCCILGGSCIISCTSSSFIFICLRREEDSTTTINIFMVTIGILSFGTAIPVWYIYDNCIRNKEDKDKDSSKDKRCFNILSIGSCGFVYVLNLLFDRPSKIKDRDAPDSQNMPLQHKDTNKPVRSAAEEQSLYSYARTGPINVVVEGGSSTRPGDKPRQT